MSYDLRLGRLFLPTVTAGIKEAVGDQIDAVGAISVAGERSPRPFSLTIPVHGESGDVDRHEAGMRMRRQLRALLRNPKARLEGLYFDWRADPELNAWLLVGRGEVGDAQAGVTLGDFQAELSDVVVVGSPRTHRQARRLVSHDRRLPSTPRDYRGTVYSTDFALQPALARHYLPVGAHDAVTSSGQTRSLTDQAGKYLDTRDGAVPFVDGAPFGESISFEQQESDRHKADVVIWDRRGGD